MRYARETAGGAEPGPWEIVEADIYLDATALLGAGEDLDAALVEVLGHELGHSAGLEHVCSLDASGVAPACPDGPARALMDLRHQAAVSGPRADDIAGICALYPPTCPTSCAVSEVCALAGCRQLGSQPRNGAGRPRSRGRRARWAVSYGAGEAPAPRGAVRSAASHYADVTAAGALAAYGDADGAAHAAGGARLERGAAVAHYG